MKKFYVAAAAALLTIPMGYSLPKFPSAKAERTKPSKCVTFSKEATQKKAVVRHAPGEVATSMDLGYCEEPYMAFYVGSGEVRGAVKFPVEMLKDFVGNKITGIQVVSPPDVSKALPDGYNYESAVQECTVWLSYGLEEAPFASANGKLSELGFEWSTVELDTPFDITADKDLYIGVTYNLPESEDVFGIVTDYGYPEDDNTCFIYSLSKGFDQSGEPIFGEGRQWLTMGAEMGNYNIRAVVEGDNLPQNKIVPLQVDMPTNIMPGQKYAIGVLFTNMGANEISSFTMSAKIGDAEPQVINADKIVIGYDQTGAEIYGPVGYRVYGIAMGEFSYDKEGNNVPWNLTITAINGTTLDEPIDLANGTLLSLKEGFPKNNVVEEGTGTWCGYCVVGIAGMEYMKENYEEDGFIGIAVHTGDQMDVTETGTAYYNLSPYLDGVPTSFLNRDVARTVYPSPEELEQAFIATIGMPSIVSIEGSLANVDDEGKSVKLSLESEFLFDGEETPYSFAYTVVEDNVGPYIQTNYLSGEDDESSYGFGSMGSKFRMAYQEVARNCSEPFGVEGSLPATITKGQKYSFEKEIKLDGVTKLDSYRVIAMVINNKTGLIENAININGPKYNGIVNATTENQSLKVITRPGTIYVSSADGLAYVYSIDGRMISRVAMTGSVSVAPGTYIVKSGKTARKVIVR